MRFAVGFSSFLLAFGLRRLHASLSWYAVALGLSAVGSLVGLGIVTRLRNKLAESTLLSLMILLTGIAAGVVARHATLLTQALFLGVLGTCAAVTQPSFDAITQRLVPAGAQGRTFARFAVRQQLTWVVGALLPVAITMSFADGDQFLCVVMLIGAVLYTLRRRHRHDD
jgi:MFS-type transporter involved in bile tolerance (Atg22 family)